MRQIFCDANVGLCQTLSKSLFLQPITSQHGSSCLNSALIIFIKFVHTRTSEYLIDQESENRAKNIKVQRAATLLKSGQLTPYMNLICTPSG